MLSSHLHALLDNLKVLAADALRADIEHLQARARLLRAVHSALCAGLKMSAIAKASCIGRDLPLTELKAEQRRLESALSNYRQALKLAGCGHQSRRTRVTVEDMLTSEPQPR